MPKPRSFLRDAGRRTDPTAGIGQTRLTIHQTRISQFSWPRRASMRRVTHEGYLARVLADARREREKFWPDPKSK